MKRFLQFLLLRFVFTYCQTNLPLCPPSVQFMPPGVPLNCIIQPKAGPSQFSYSNLQQMFPMMKYNMMSSPSPLRKDGDFQATGGGSTLSPSMGSINANIMNYSPGQLQNLMMPQQPIPIPSSNQPVIPPVNQPANQQPINPPPAPPQPNPVITVPGTAGVSDPMMGQGQPLLSPNPQQRSAQFIMNEAPNSKTNSLVSMPFYSQNGKSEPVQETRPDSVKSDEDRSSDKDEEPISKFPKLNDDTARSLPASKRLIVSPVLAYVTKDGHIMYQKKLNDMDALYWLKKEMTDKKEDEGGPKNMKRLLQSHKSYGDKRSGKSMTAKYRKNEQKDDDHIPHGRYADLPIASMRRRERSTFMNEGNNDQQQRYKRRILGDTYNQNYYYEGNARHTRSHTYN